MRRLALGVLVAGQQLRQEGLGVPRGRRGEDHLPSAALVGDDQVLVALEVPATPVAVMEEQAVQVQDERDAQRLVGVEAHEHVDGVSVARELPLVAVAVAVRALCDALGALAVENHALDRVGGRDRGDAGVLGELPQQLGRLVLEEPFPASARVDPGQDGAERTGLAVEGPVEVDEAAHRANHAIVALI